MPPKQSPAKSLARNQIGVLLFLPAVPILDSGGSITKIALLQRKPKLWYMAGTQDTATPKPEALKATTAMLVLLVHAHCEVSGGEQ